MTTKIYLYPLVIRLWHVINIVTILLLILTGISLQYSDPSHPFIRFDLAVQIHNIFGVVLILSYVLFFLGNIFSGNVKHYKITLDEHYFSKLVKQSIYYSYGIFKGAKPPFPINESNKFNPLQQFSYIVIMYVFVPSLIITGIGLLLPELVPNKIVGYGGIFVTDLMHIIGGFIVTVFLFVHIYFCTIGKNPFKNFKSIFTGWHEDNH